MKRDQIVARIEKLKQDIQSLRAQLLVADCGYCGKPFTRQRLKDSEIPCCGKKRCLSAASMRRINESRARKTEELLRLAAHLWPAWRESYGPRSKWVAFKITSMRQHVTIKSNWVTRHEKEILNLVVK